MVHSEYSIGQMRSSAIAVVIATTAILTAGCASVELGYTDAYYQKRMLNVSSIDGANRLRVESGHDQKLRGYVASNGKPDYLYVINQYESYFIYLSPEKCVRFERSPLWANARITELEVTPPEFRSMIPEWSGAFIATPPASPPSMPKGEIATPPASPPSMPKGELISSGSGFSVSASEIATAYHVVADSKSIEVRFGDADWISAKLVKESESTDIAILEIDEERSNYLPPIVEHETLPGDRIFTMGFPAVEILGTEAKYTEGVVSSLSGLGNDSCLLQITVPVQPGSSGGPLVREDGVLVGMVTSTAAVTHFAAVTAALPQNVNWGVKADYISLLMTEKAKKRTTGDRRAILEAVNDSVCRIRAK